MGEELTCERFPVKFQMQEADEDVAAFLFLDSVSSLSSDFFRPQPEHHSVCPGLRKLREEGQLWISGLSPADGFITDCRTGG